MITPTRRSRFGALSAITGLALTSAASAGLLDNGTTTLNTDTGLEYLDMSFTNNEYPGAYLLGIPPARRPVPAGFRPGTSAEALALFAEVGLGSSDVFSPSAFAPIDFLLDFIGGLTVSNLSGRTDIQTNIATSTPNGNANQIVGYRLRILDEHFPTSTDYGEFRREDASYSGASNTLGTLHVRQKANATPATAITPDTSDASGQEFFGIDGNGVWVSAAAPTSGGVKLTGTGDNLIRAVGIPESFADSDSLITLIDPVLGEIVLMPGDVHTLSTPAMMVELTGIDAGAPALLAGLAVDSSLPLFVAFDTDTGDLLISEVPAPPSLMLWAVMGGMGLKRRR